MLSQGSSALVRILSMRNRRRLTHRLNSHRQWSLLLNVVSQERPTQLIVGFRSADFADFLRFYVVGCEFPYETHPIDEHPPNRRFKVPTNSL